MKSQRGLAVRATVRLECDEPTAHRAGECAHGIIVAHKSTEGAFERTPSPGFGDPEELGDGAHHQRFGIFVKADITQIAADGQRCNAVD